MPPRHVAHLSQICQRIDHWTLVQLTAFIFGSLAVARMLLREWLRFKFDYASGRRKKVLCMQNKRLRQRTFWLQSLLLQPSLFQWTKLTKSYITGRLVSSGDLPASSRKMEDASSRFAACCWLDLCLAPNEMNCVTFFSVVPRNDLASRAAETVQGTHTQRAS